MTGRSIAVIGGGIGGLTAGYVLSRTDHVTLFEADGRLGGHADTHLVGQVPVDTGFIVYNERTYPLLTRLFAELGVMTRACEMSMSVRCAGCGLHYAGQRGLGGVACGLSRGGGRFLRMLADVPRFHRAARRLLGSGAAGEPTFGEFLDEGGYSGYFRAHFAVPLVEAVWSCPAGTALEYPARYLFAFLANHGMLSVSGSPSWRTVAGGSRCYVQRAVQRLAGGRVLMLTHARVFGYVFNPLTVYWCHQPDGTLACVVAEVHNTYRQRHAYLLRTDERGRALVRKQFYVSPFYPVNGRYRMNLPEPALLPVPGPPGAQGSRRSRLALSVTLERPDGWAFVASVHGTGVPATAQALLRATARHPCSTAAVTARIRWQGIRLYLRGLPVVPRPPHTPQEDVQ